MQAYLSYKSLNMTPDIWASLDAAKQQEVVEARVWEPANKAQFLKDVRRGCASIAASCTHNAVYSVRLNI